MKRIYMDPSDVWEFEKYLAINNPKVWINEAINLKYSAKVLISYDNEVTDCIFNKKIQPRFPGFFTARVIRMLFSFSLENLVKCVLFRNKPDDYLIKGKLNFGKSAHDLSKLFSDASIKVNSDEDFYLEVWTKCAIYAGRYPLPRKKEDLPMQRKPLPIKELIKREMSEMDEHIRTGNRLSDINDILHSGVGNIEERIFDTLFTKLLELINNDE